MKSALFLSLSAAAFAAAVTHPKDRFRVQGTQLTLQEPDECLLELAPGETVRATDADKWALRRVCTHNK